MSSELITKIDSSFKNEKAKLQYPYIMLHNYGDELGLVVTCINEGTIPIVVMHDSMLTQIFSVELSAPTLAKLCRVYNFTVFIDKDTKMEVKTTADVMEVIPWMLS